jgi:dipeptidase E
MKLLLVSNSTQHGGGYLEHCADEVETLFAGVKNLLFVPFALHDHDAYTAIVRKRFASDREVIGLHEPADPVAAVRDAEAIFIGGGNTFRLLKGLYDRRLIEPIRQRVADGMPYLGTSAGTNVATCTIKTTNDMPIVEPPSFDALSLVPFQINPHFIDADPDSKHMGETRAQRLQEFHEENETPVLALREGAMVRVIGKHAKLLGTTGALAFRRGREPEPLGSGSVLDDWLR